MSQQHQVGWWEATESPLAYSTGYDLQKALSHLVTCPLSSMPDPHGQNYQK